MGRFLTAESVTEGHPDKICDQISDAVLDEVYKQDPNGRVAVETVVKGDTCILAGELTTSAKFDLEQVVRKVVKKIGYTKEWGIFNYEDITITQLVSQQSPDIAIGVDVRKNKELGAGDQGIMAGYATNETKEFMPLPIVLAHKLTRRLDEVRKHELAYLGPDGKSQVTIEYGDCAPKRIEALVIGAQHKEGVDYGELKCDILNYVIKPVCGDLIDDKTKIFINATGNFVVGGPVADTGLTGRKIILDSYGPIAYHGGGAFSGKDPTKVDRSAAYMCRYIAKNIVAAGLADRCVVELSYVIGYHEPLSLYVETFGTGKLSEEELERIVRKEFPLTPGGIIKHLNLRQPIYSKTAVYGHFGRDDSDFTWERTDKAESLKKYFVDKGVLK